MANVRLGAKAVGSTVKIKVNGTVKDFIIVHQGIPDAGIYDASCNGTWLMMKDIYENRQWHRTNTNDYAGSTTHSYLNDNFYNLIDSEIRAAIKQVKIPCQKGRGWGSLATGENGLSTKVFLLSGYEVGWAHNALPKDGAKLDYFGSGSGGNSKRVAYNGSNASTWWLRSPYTVNRDTAWTVLTDGSCDNKFCEQNTCGVRPAFILPAEFWVRDDGSIAMNCAPAINASSTNLGEQNAPFDFNYTVTDADGDPLTVTEKLDGKTTATRTGVVSGTALTFGQGSTAENFQRILNGSHTIQIIVSDGKESTSASATFTKSVTSASVTLTTPLAVDGDITVAILQVTGSIPDDAVFKAEVTNNAKDAAPVWQDATKEVQKGTNIVFANSTAANGAAFNFRISVSRGASGTGGYIEAVSGAFQ